MNSMRMSTSLRCTTLLAGVFAVFPGSRVVAQSHQPPTRLECDHVLNGPSRDSTSLVLTIESHAFDRRDELPDPVQAAIADGIHTFFRVPRPLAVDTWAAADSGSHRAHLTLFAAYRATLVRDGSIRLASALTGAGNGPIDRAILDALRMLDSSRMLEPVAKTLSSDETLVILRMRFNDADSAALTKLGASIPLVKLRVPLRTITHDVAQIPGYGNLRYPDDLRSLGIAGQVNLAFVVGDDGLYEDGTAMSDRVDHVSFLRAVLVALPAMRFRPMEVEGCPVRTVVSTPFTFALLDDPRHPNPQ